MHHGTNSAATMAPKFEPLLKMPVARARSRLGNHSATVLMEAGKLPASPTANALRTRMCIVTSRPTKALAMPKMDQTMSDRARPSLVPILSMTQPGHDGHAGIKGREEGGQIGEVGVRPAEPALFRRRAEKLLQVADDLPVQVIEGGGEKQQPADDPAIMARSRRGLAWRNSCMRNIAENKRAIQALKSNFTNRRRLCHAAMIMLKKFLAVLPVLLLTGCATTFTRLTPLEQPRNPNNLYPVEVAFQFLAAIAALGQHQALRAGQWRAVPDAPGADDAKPLGRFRAGAAGGQLRQLPFQIRLSLQRFRPAAQAQQRLFAGV